MAKRREDIDLAMHRIETIERRLENIERAVYSKNDAGSINTELLNIVLNMVRPQTAMQPSVQLPAASASHASATPAVASPPVDATGVTCSSFTNRRRSTIGF